MYWGWTQTPINQGLSNNLEYTSLLGDYTSKLSSMPSTESGGYLSQVPVPSVTYPTMPAYSLGRERALQQQYAGPSANRLRTGLLTTLATARNRPFPAQSYLTREALSGYGEGLGSIMASALNPAQRAQMQELEYEKAGLLGRYSADYQNALLKYQQDTNAALMKEKERQSLIEAINRLKLMELNKSISARNVSASPAQAQASLLNLMAGYQQPTIATPKRPDYEVIWGPPINTTPSTSPLDEWKKTWGGG